MAEYAVGEQKMKRIVISAFAAFFCLACFLAMETYAGTNLLVNPSFNDPEDPLKGWMYDYSWLGRGRYVGNRKYIKVLPQKDGRKGVLKISGRPAAEQGAKVDSKPVPFERGCIYKFSLSSRTTGTGSRFLIEGYQWKPGVRPYKDPEIYDLRKVYAGLKLGASGSWKRQSKKFPGTNPSKLSLKHLKKVKFIVVHLIAVTGDPSGDVYVDDVELTKVGYNAQLYKKLSDAVHY